MRARELGIEIGFGIPGAHNAITDVAGIRVGHSTIIEGEGPLVVGEGPIRTGVTVIRPHEGHLAEEPLFAGCHSLNGNGEVTGLLWLKQSGQLTSAIGLTNSHSVGVVRDTLAVIDTQGRQPEHLFWSLPVTGETWDGMLNDINGFHVKPEHVLRAYENATDGPVEEGSVGGGTGMICYMFKGGIGTSSRVLPREFGGYTVGVLVQANFGTRRDFIVNGAPVGQHLGEEEILRPCRRSMSSILPPARSRLAAVARLSASRPLTLRYFPISATAWRSAWAWAYPVPGTLEITGVETSSWPSPRQTACPGPI